MSDAITLQEAKDKLPLIPEKLFDKANSLANVLNSPDLMLGNKLDAIYSYLEEFKAYIGKYASCSKNCSFCCNMDVQITTLEAEYIHINTGVPLKRGKSITTGHTNRCPFLSSSGSCNIYKSRPMPCRFLFAFGEPENCAHGKQQIQYGVQAAGFGNPIFKKLIMWVHSQAIHGGGELRDIRDYFA